MSKEQYSDAYFMAVGELSLQTHYEMTGERLNGVEMPCEKATQFVANAINEADDFAEDCKEATRLHYIIEYVIMRLENGYVFTVMMRYAPNGDLERVTGEEEFQ